jgi:hypothetical protein
MFLYGIAARLLKCLSILQNQKALTEHLTQLFAMDLILIPLSLHSSRPTQAGGRIRNDDFIRVLHNPGFMVRIVSKQTPQAIRPDNGTSRGQEKL